MSPLTLAEAEYPIKKRKTRRKRFLENLEQLLPWKQVEVPIARHYPHGGIGRSPYPRSAMLCIHVMQLVYNLSDPAMEDARYGIESMRRFAGIGMDRVPDETTILNFRPFLSSTNWADAGGESREELATDEREWPIAMRPKKFRQLASAGIENA